MDENNEHENEAVEVVEIDYDDDNEDPEGRSPQKTDKM